MICGHSTAYSRSAQRCPAVVVRRVRPLPSVLIFLLIPSLAGIQQVEILQGVERYVQVVLTLCDVEPRIIEPGLRRIVAHYDLFQPASGQVQYIYGPILSTRCQRGECYVLRVWRPLDAADLIHGCTEEGLQPLPIGANQLQSRLVLGKSQGDEENPLSIR